MERCCKYKTLWETAPSEITSFLRKKIFLTEQFEVDFETSEFDFEVSKPSIWKHTTSCDKGVFSSIIILQLRQPIEFKFSQFCYFMLGYTMSEDWSFTITNSVQCLNFILFYWVSLNMLKKKMISLVLAVCSIGVGQHVRKGVGIS